VSRLKEIAHVIHPPQAGIPRPALCHLSLSHKGVLAVL
jgi:hypothetical protein